MSDLINMLFLIITIFTVNYARKTLFFAHSPLIHVQKYNRKLYRNKNRQLKLRITSDIKSVGNGTAIKLFMMVSDKRKSRIGVFRNYFLSKPVSLVKPKDVRKLSIELSEKTIGKNKNNFKDIKLYIIYQDMMGGLFYVNPVYHNDNKHLERFDKGPKRLSKFGIRYWIFRFRFWLSRVQGNTSVSKINIILHKTAKANKNVK